MSAPFIIPGYDPRRDTGGARFVEEAAQDAIDFFAELKHVKGALAGKPLKLEPWQEVIIRNLFGWIRPDGTRRYREALVYTPRKSGKTTIAAAIMLYMLFADNEPGAELIVAAADRDQARLVFSTAEGMVRQSEWMMSECQIYRASHTIVMGTSSLKAVSADAPTKHGLNAHCVVVDELHSQPNRDLVDVLTTSTGARRQPLVVHITTADFDRESICNEKYAYARRVRDGIISDPSFLPVIYEAPKDSDWTDPKVWQIANPNLGVSIGLDYLERECQRAKESPAYENTFKRLHLNIVTEQDIRWLQMDRWDASDGSLDLARLVGRQCWAGLDLSTTTDLSAFVMVFPEADGHYAALCHFWVPEANARQRERRDRVPYLQWIQHGLITATPGAVIDYDYIRRDINALRERYDIREVAADRWNATQLIGQLAGDGVEIFAHGQGYKDMTAPTKELEKLVIAGKIRTNNNAVMRWMASNATVEQDAAGNVKPSKKKSTERIDGLVALVMGLGRAMIRTDDEGLSFFDVRGEILTV